MCHWSSVRYVHLTIIQSFKYKITIVTFFTINCRRVWTYSSVRSTDLHETWDEQEQGQGNKPYLRSKAGNSLNARSRVANLLKLKNESAIIVANKRKLLPALIWRGKKKRECLIYQLPPPRSTFNSSFHVFTLFYLIRDTTDNGNNIYCRMTSISSSW